jgi:copper chaperone
MARTKLNVTGMTCQHCVGAITAALEEIDGVRSARVDLGAHTAVVDYDDSRTDPHRLAAAVTEAGYPAEQA